MVPSRDSTPLVGGDTRRTFRLALVPFWSSVWCTPFLSRTSRQATTRPQSFSHELCSVRTFSSSFRAFSDILGGRCRGAPIREFPPAGSNCFKKKKKPHREKKRERGRFYFRIKGNLFFRIAGRSWGGSEKGGRRFWRYWRYLRFPRFPRISFRTTREPRDPENLESGNPGSLENLEIRKT